MMNAYKILVRITEGKRPPGRPRSMWVDNIENYVRNKVVWTGLIWLRVYTSVRIL
jgi:hypothetical protein